MRQEQQAVCDTSAQWQSSAFAAFREIETEIEIDEEREARRMDPQHRMAIAHPTTVRWAWKEESLDDLARELRHIMSEHGYRPPAEEEASSPPRPVSKRPEGILEEIGRFATAALPPMPPFRPIPVTTPAAPLPRFPGLPRAQQPPLPRFGHKLVTLDEFEARRSTTESVKAPTGSLASTSDAPWAAEIQETMLADIEA